MNKWIMVLMMVANTASAAKLENVEILSVTPSKDAVELKLHATQGPEGSFFFVDVVKSDPAAFDKMALVLKKVEKRAEFRLDLEIKSFSMFPNGSYYRSESVDFSGVDLGNQAKAKKKAGTEQPVRKIAGH